MDWTEGWFSLVDVNIRMVDLDIGLVDLVSLVNLVSLVDLKISLVGLKKR